MISIPCPSFPSAGWIFDWQWLETQNGTSVTKVVRDGVKVKILGRDLRTFKPGVPFTLYVSTLTFVIGPCCIYLQAL